MNLKGSVRLQGYVLIMTLLALVVGVAFFNGINNFIEDTTYWKIYYARDLGLLLDAGITGRGEIEMSYDTLYSTQPLTIRLLENHLEVFEYNPLLKNKIPASFRFGSDKNIRVEKTEINSSSFKIVINEEKVNFSQEILQQEKCSNINTSTNINNIYMYIEADNGNVENILKSGLEAYGFNLLDTPINANLTLIVQEIQDDILRINYYKKERKAEKLACMIKNAILNVDEKAFSFFEFNMISGFDLLYPVLTQSQQGLVIQINELNEEKVNIITQEVFKYYG